MKLNKWLLLTFVLSAHFSCVRDANDEVLGYAPIYGNEAEVKNITLSGPQPVTAGGKIYVIGNMLLQVESGTGVHVTDISNPTSPQKKAFINVKGAQEVAVKDGLIYTNNLSDLVVLQYSNNNISVIKRLPGAFTNLANPQLPPERGRFECPEKNKGVIIGWQKKTLINPKCDY